MVVRMEDEADLDLAMLAAPVLQVQIADQLTGRGEFDGDGEELPFLPQRRAVHSLGERGGRFRPAASTPVKVARDVGTGLEGVQGVEVIRAERPEDQAFGGIG
jgi:hypothetical protein